MPDKRIPELGELLLSTSELYIPVYLPQTDTTYRIKKSVLVPAAETQDYAWNPNLVYDENQISVLDDQVWISQQDDNEGVMPGTDEDYWVSDVRVIGSSIKMHAPGVYFEDEAFVANELFGKLYIFRLANPTRPFISADFEAEFNAGDWVVAGQEWEVSGFTELVRDVQIMGDGDLFGFAFQEVAYFEVDALVVGIKGNSIIFSEESGDDTWVGAEYLVPPTIMSGNSIPYVDWVLDEITAAVAGGGGWPLSGTETLDGNVIMEGDGVGGPFSVTLNDLSGFLVDALVASIGVLDPGVIDVQLAYNATNATIYANDLNALSGSSLDVNIDGTLELVATDGFSGSAYEAGPFGANFNSIYSGGTRVSKIETFANNNTLYAKLSASDTGSLSYLTASKSEILGESRKIRLKNRSGLSAVHINYLGAIDTDFAPNAGANSNIGTILRLPDGKFLIGGAFTTYDGVSRNRIARINADGTLDTSFNPGTGFNNSVTGIVRQSDGKFIVTGAFTSFNSVTGKNRIVRLNTDGTIDGAYTPGTGFATGNTILTVIQSDDKVIAVGGGNYNGTTGLGFIVRINTDGTRDATFGTGTGFNSAPSAIKMQPDGNILLGGAFITFKGVSQIRLARIDSSGNIDATLVLGTSFNLNSVAGIDLYSDGRIIVVGGFTSYNGNTAVRIARLSSTGTYDATLVTGLGFDGGTPTFVNVGIDEKIYVGGNYETFDGVTQHRFVRLNSNGSKDTDFDITDQPVGTSGSVSAAVVLPDGQLVIGGNFANWDGFVKGSTVKLTVRSEVRIYGDLIGVNIDRTKYTDFSYIDKGYIASKVLTGSATLDFGSTAAQSSTDLTIAVTGAVVGDAVSLATPTASILANSSFTAWVSAADTVTVRFNNYSAGALDPASGTFKATVIKQI